MTREELLAALAEARDLPDGEAKIAELERIIAHVDALGDVRLGVTVRFALIEAHQHHTDRWRMLTPFEWCLAAADRHPSTVDQAGLDRLRRLHPAAVGTVLGDSRVGLARAEDLLGDLERRLDAAGRTPRSGYALRCRIADHVGDLTAAGRWLARWRAAAPDAAVGCAACELVDQARLLADWGRWAEAVEAAEAVLTGEVTCPEQPERALAVLQVPYLRLGRHAEAAQAHVRAYRRHRDERAAFGFLADHLRFCALAGQHGRGLEILGRHLGQLDRPYDEMSAMEFAAAGALVCRLAGLAGLNRYAIHRPGHAERRAANLTVAALGTELRATTQDLAGRFDARNGSSHQSGRMAAWLAERPRPEPVPLPADPPVSPWAPPGPPPPEGRREVVAPLTLAAIVAVLDDRADHYVVDANGIVHGRWGDALIQFIRLGERGEILHVRTIAQRRLPVDRLTEAYEFCNSWNHDRLLPKAYVLRADPDGLVLAGEVTTDLEHGVAQSQLTVLVTAALSTGAAFAAAVAALP